VQYTTTKLCTKLIKFWLWT